MKYDSSELCPECEILRPKRSRHCEICNRCVYVFDHHCPFINNCVGAKNHKYFLFFLISLWLEILYKMFFIGLDLLDKDLQYIYIFKYTDSDIFLFKIFVSVALLILSCTIFLPLSILLWTHINNFTLNKTSSERFGFKKKDFSEGNLEEINSVNNNISSVNASFEIDVNEKPKKGESNFYIYIKNCYLMCYPPLQN